MKISLKISIHLSWFTLPIYILLMDSVLLCEKINCWRFNSFQQTKRLWNYLGSPDPLKTAFVRHSSTVICTAEVPHVLAIEPRDEFNNLCHFLADDDPIAGYTISISQVSEYAYHLMSAQDLSLFPVVRNKTTIY